MKIVAFLILTLLAPLSWAQDDSDLPGESASSGYKVKLDVKESRLMFGLYGQMSQFTRQGTSLTGCNIEGMADYAILDRTAVQISINQSLDMANGISVLFTGLRLGGAYAWWGEFTQRSALLEVNNADTLAVRPSESTMLVSDIGIEQYLFNGTDRVVPATGLSLGLRLDKSVWGLRLSGMLRYGSLVISQDPVSMITAGVGTVVRF